MPTRWNGPLSRGGGRREEAKLNQELRRLLDLQDMDVRIERLRSDVEGLPVEMEAARARAGEAKAQLEAARQELVRAQLDRKQLEVDLETKEAAIRKHQAELNLVKVNDAYRALLKEIEEGKRAVGELEEKILVQMEAADTLSRRVKQQEQESRRIEAEVTDQVRRLEADLARANEALAAEEEKRAAFVSGFSGAGFRQYARIRKHLRGAVIVPIQEESCGGCHMRVPAQVIVEARRDAGLVCCDNCTRILFYAAVAAA